MTSYGEVADCIARQAYDLGKDPSYISPFAKGAAEVGKRFQGGKHDDITITVAQIFTDASGYEKKAHTEDFFEELISLYHVSPTKADVH